MGSIVNQFESGGRTYRIIKYAPSYREQVLRLERLLWGGNPSHDSAFFRWKYETNPNNGANAPMILLAVSGEDVIGVTGAYASRWRFGNSDKELKIIQSGDFIVSPEHRNRGVGTVLRRNFRDEAAANGYDLLFEFTPFPTTAHIQSKYMHSLGSYQMMHRHTARSAMLTRASLFLKKLPLAWRYADIGFSSTLFGRNGLVSSHVRYPAGTAFGKDGRVRVEDTPRPLEMTTLVQRLGFDDRLTQICDEEFFAWRFQNPRRQYRFLYHATDRLRGYLVLQSARTENPDTISIVDWRFETLDVGRELIFAAITCAGSDPLCLWSVTLSQKQKELLANTGFRLDAVTRQHKDNALQFQMSPLQTGGSDARDLNGLKDIGRFDLRMIFADVF